MQSQMLSRSPQTIGAFVWSALSSLSNL